MEKITEIARKGCCCVWPAMISCTCAYVKREREGERTQFLSRCILLFVREEGYLKTNSQRAQVSFRDNILELELGEVACSGTRWMVTKVLIGLKCYWKGLSCPVIPHCLLSLTAQSVGSYQSIRGPFRF